MTSNGAREQFGCKKTPSDAGHERQSEETLLKEKLFKITVGS